MDYVPFLRLQRESCRRFGLDHVVITDAGGAAEFGGELACHVVPGLPEDLMHLILQGLSHYLLTRDEVSGPILLCGADCIIGADPAPLFVDMSAGAVTAAFTTHPFLDCILNMGAQYIAANRARVAGVFYNEACRRLAGMPSGGTLWGDDQRAFASVWDPTLQHGDFRRRLVNYEVKVRFLPVHGFNDAPDHAGDPCSPPLPVVVHFRGPRKQWMADWTGRHLGFSA